MTPQLPTGSSGKTAQQIAIAAAELAGRLAASSFTKTKRLRYKGTRDIVTDVDVAAEKAIVDLLHQEFPDHGFLAEESGTSGAGADYQWVIDPVDGTTNYSQMIPIFCTSIALAYRGEIILGVIKDPLHKDLYVAAKGQGATLNGKPLQVSTKTNLIDAVVGFDLGYNDTWRAKVLGQAQVLLPLVRTLRLIGSAALALAFTAAGRYDAFFHHWLYPWDFAAASLMITEAGGKVTDWEGNPVTLETRGFVVSNSVLHDEILRLLNSDKG